MAIPGPFHCSTTLRLFISVMCVLGILVTDAAGGQHHRRSMVATTCPPFTCGRLGDVSSPFHRRGDPLECGVPSYQLNCTGDEATIQIDNGTYFVTAINYKDSTDNGHSTFWVVDTNVLDPRNTCPLPHWNRLPYYYNETISLEESESHHGVQVVLDPALSSRWSVFVNCSQEINGNEGYMPVTCMSTTSSFIYVLTCKYFCFIENLEPSCGYLAMTPLGALENDVVPMLLKRTLNFSYEDVVKLMRKGFSVQFPFRYHTFRIRTFKECIIESFPKLADTGKPDWFGTILLADTNFLSCVPTHQIPSPYRRPVDIILIAIVFALQIMKMIAALCRFLLAPLAILVFLSYKYWKTRVTIDAVEKFLRMQQMLGPTRYAYTDITAITSHFREKLGQGGYGSVYKGVLLPGDLHVAVKMLNGNSNCNGEEFISEVATIGMIHHVNVVRLVGFCSEEMRRALVYEYMPRGSLDKYIFLSERGFSWDKLNEIAVGIARGVNYLHQGCDMQILHFDIKPHNILLDNDFVPKVADFGLAKLYPRDKSFVPDRALWGTIGYIAPEMVSRSFGVVSTKSDVYSFGMLLLEMAGGRRNADPNVTNSNQIYYPSLVYNKLKEQEVGEICAATDMHDLERKLYIVGLCCIQMKSYDRPTMSEVIEMLEGGVDGLQVPPRPFFCDEEHMPPVVDSYRFSSKLNEISEGE
uniref:Protein kinase domain-containing protein n=1 Tax=Leersia perrieri TaxID=77586 RepID=A0A0D9UW33_9ORYZ